MYAIGKQTFFPNGSNNGLSRIVRLDDMRTWTTDQRRMSYSLHCIKKLVDRDKVSVTPLDEASTSSRLLSNWYATALFWDLQMAFLGYKESLLPMLMQMAPASSLVKSKKPLF